MSEVNLIYKITALCLLSKADFALSNKQVTEFFISENYTDYFNIQQILNDLVESEMIAAEQTANETTYKITAEGLDTLSLFQERITESIEEDIKNFFKENGLEMRKENSVTSNYYPSTTGGYYVHLHMAEETRSIMDFTFHVSSEEQAKSICTNWRSNYENAYITLLEQLM